MSRRFLTAEWRNLVMLNYEIDPSILRPPRGTELDPFDGKYFVSLVGFNFLNTRVLGLPIPFHRNFEEVNLRYYVRRKAADGWRRGVVFVKEIVPRFAIAAVARWLYNENYVACPMSSNVHLPDDATDTPGSAEYRWTSHSRENRIHAEFRGSPICPSAGSEAEFFTEHYWGYVPQRDGSSLEYRVEHPPWQVWHDCRGSIDIDIKDVYGEPYQEALNRPASSAFVAAGSEVSVWRGEGIPA